MQKKDADLLNGLDLGQDFEIGEYIEVEHDGEDDRVGVADNLDDYYEDYNEDLKKGKEDWMRDHSYNENYRNPNYYDGKFDETVKLAKSGSPKGLYDLGYRYYWGFDVNENRKLAFRYFFLAARKGYKTDYLERCLRTGFNIEEEAKAKKIAEWLADARNLDNIHDKDFREFMAKAREKGIRLGKVVRRRRN